MLVNNNVYRHLYVGNGTTREFPFKFPILEASHILVRLKNPLVPAVTLINPVDYTLVGVEDPEGGAITIAYPPIVNAELLLSLNVPLSQITKYIELDVFPSLSHENALSKLTLICQMITDALSRTVSVPEWGAPDIPGFPNNPGDPMTPEEFIEWFIHAWLDVLTARDEVLGLLDKIRAEADRACACAEEACYCADISCGCAGSLVTPRVISPADNSVNVEIAPFITVSELEYEGRPDTPKATQIQVTTAADTSYQTPVWSYDNGYTTMVKIDDSRVAQPTVTSPANGAVNVSPTPTIQVTAFATTGAADAAELTNIEITRPTDVEFNQPLWEYNSTYTQVATPDVSLDYGTTCIVRAAHKGATLGWSMWSPTNSFTIQATAVPTINTPSVLTPANGEQNAPSALSISLSPFTVSQGTDTASGTQVQIAAMGDINFSNVIWEYAADYTTSITNPTSILTNGSSYVIRARHSGVLLGWSEWSAINNFKIEAVPVNLLAPEIILPAEGASNVSMSPTIEVTNIARSDGAVVDGIYTRIQVTTATDTGFAAPIWQYDNIYDTQVIMIDVALVPDTQYIARAAHCGDTGEWTEWSQTRHFKASAQYINQATITEIDGADPGSKTVKAAFFLKLSTFGTTPSGLTQQVGYQIAITKASDTDWIDYSLRTDQNQTTNPEPVGALTTDEPEATAPVPCKAAARWWGLTGSLPYGQFSPVVYFNIEPWGIKSFTSSIDNPKVASRKIKILWSAWQIAGSIPIKPVFTHLQIATTATFNLSTLVFDNATGNPYIDGNLTSYEMEEALAPATTYWLRARRRGNLNDNDNTNIVGGLFSAWSNVVNFTTA